jgi:surface polysaccharide O-acyltransferase-like enzyme
MPIYSQASEIVFYFCGCAIPLFIMITGYFILNKSNINTKYCYIKALNILKIIVVWNIIDYVIDTVYRAIKYGTASLELSILDLPEAVINSTITQENSFLDHFWYLGMLMMIYIILPILLLIRSKWGAKNLTILLFAITVAIQFISMIIGYEIQDLIPQSFRLWIYAFYLFLGSNMKAITNHIENKINILTHLLMTIVITILNIIYQMYFAYRIKTYSSVMWTYDYYGSLFEIIWVTMIFSLILRIKIRSNGITEKVINTITPLTFGIYIIHDIIRKRLFVISRNNYKIQYSILAFIVVIFASAVLTIILNHLPLKIRNTLLKI